MSAPTAPQGAPGRLRLLEWDTEFFGRRIASVTAPGLDAGDLAACVEEARAQRIECVYILSDIEAHAAIRAAERAGATLVDVRMTFERDLGGLEAAPDDDGVRPSRPTDVSALRALAARSHGSSRFYVDGRFPPRLCDELFATWVQKSCAGWAEVALVADRAGQVSGYVTGHVRPDDRGEIGLVAVARHAQGERWGSRLVHAALQAFRARGLRRASVVTQGRNLPAQRLYESTGFRIARMQLWHHLWLDQPGSAS